MRKAHLLTTAAALLLTVGAVSAQEIKKDEAPARAPAAQRNAPAEKIAPALKSERKIPETTGQATKEPEKAHEKTEMKGHMGKDSAMKKKGAMDNKAAETHPQSNMKAKSSSTANEGTATSTKSSQSVTEKQSTTGQGAAAGSAKLSADQRSKITSIIRQHKVSPVHVNVSVRIGTRVPDHVHFYPLPEQVYVIYPEWRGYDYILVGDQILVIEPRTHEIVAILEA